MLQPTLPLRGATSDYACSARTPARLQPTLPLRGATSGRRRAEPAQAASTHAPLAGSDYRYTGRFTGLVGASTHAPLAGSDAQFGRHNRDRLASTHAPLAGSDIAKGGSPPRLVGFNPRSPCGERRRFELIWPRGTSFNPRSPCGERLPNLGDITEIDWLQPTLPLRGATC